jgi:hypothetical protein
MLTNRSSSRHHLRSCRIACLRGTATLAQLPSPRAYSLEVVIWYIALLEIRISHMGLKPHKPMPVSGVPIVGPKPQSVRFEL